MIKIFRKIEIEENVLNYKKKNKLQLTKKDDIYSHHSFNIVPASAKNFSQYNKAKK